MNKNQLQGYLLEDVVSKLLEINGYQLITEVGSDNDLLQIHNGLNVVGRGGYHQFDSLGQFKWTMPFTYPTRLFVEAKFRNSSASIDLVRKGVGILVDLNHNYTTINVDNKTLSLPRYDYHYAIFSTSGFSDNAMKMAIAHKIHLIDLSGDEYKPLIKEISEFVDMIFDLYGYGDPENIEASRSRIVRKKFREIIKLSVEREPIDYSVISAMRLRSIQEGGEKVYEEIEKIGAIYLATTATPFLIALKVNDNIAFKKSLSYNPNQKVLITWNREDEEWIINPEEANYFIKFKLPSVIAKYIFSDNKNDIENAALYTKETLFSKLTFIADIKGEGHPTICSLTFDKKATEEYLETSLLS